MSYPQIPAAAAASRPRRRRTIVATFVLLLLVLAVTGFMLSRVPAAEFIVDVGPVALPAGADHATVRQPAPRAVAIPVDGWLRGFSVDLVDPHGRAIPKQLLHHVNLIAPQKRELFSPIMLRLGAAGPETRPVKLPPVLGYRLRRGDSLLVTAMLHNPTITGHQQAIIRVRLAYTPDDSWLRPIAIHPFYLDVMPPAGKHAYAIPPGRSEKSWEGRPAIDGRIVGVGGHLHKYSIALRLQDVTEGKVLWEAVPETDADGTIIKMPTKYFLPFGIPVRADHVYRLTAIYDNPTGQVLPDGGMGALGGAVLPDDEALWPSVAPEHPVYRHDVKITYGGHRGHTHAAPAHSGEGRPHSH